MYAIATFAVVALITLVLTRLATGILLATGMPKEIARFQARSAYSGAGFTTAESENVVNHPVRRRTVYHLMMIGSLGTPTLVITVVLGFVAPGPGDSLDRLIGVLVALAVVVVVLGSGPVTRWLEGRGRRYCEMRLLDALADEAEEVVDLGDDFVVSCIPLASDTDPEAPRSLRALRSQLDGVDVLGVRQQDEVGRTYVGRAPADLELRAGDSLVVHGPRSEVDRLVQQD